MYKIPSTIIDEAVDILQSEGIIFGDKSKVGIYLDSIISRKELENSLKPHFPDPYEVDEEEWGKCLSVRSLAFTDEYDHHYFFYISSKLTERVSDTEDIDKIIKRLASKHYCKPVECITFEYI